MNIFQIICKNKMSKKIFFERNPASFFLKLQGHQIISLRVAKWNLVKYNSFLEDSKEGTKYCWKIFQIKSARVERNTLRPNLSFTTNMWWPERSQTIYLKLKNEVFWKEFDKKNSQVIYLYQQPTIWRRWYWPRAKSFPLSNCGSTKNGDLQVTDGSKAIRKV